MSAPNFLIVGSCRSGTTSAYEYLRHHPEVYLPAANKEPNRFAPSTGRSRIGEAEYAALFADAGDARAIGEASTSYLYDPEAANLIRTTLGPGTRIVIFLRNPVDMAHSLWSYQVREGYEPLGFEEALRAEARRIGDSEFCDQCRGWWANFAYLSRAHYAGQVRRYLEQFGRDHVQVHLFEEFFQPGLSGYRHLLQFLGVDPEHRPLKRVHNRAGRVRSRWLQEALRTPRFWTAPGRLLPPDWQDAVRRRFDAWNRVDSERQAMDPAIRAELERKLRDDIIDLGRQLNRDLRSVWQPEQRSGVSR